MPSPVTKPDNQQLNRLCQQVASLLQATNKTLITAESCTGGWIAKCCTDLAGSSAWFEGGFVSYSNAAKQRMLGVSSQLIQQTGAVSVEVATAMASGALLHSEAEIAVAVTGIAGPGGGSQAKRVGTVWFAWAGYQDAEDHHSGILTKTALECFAGGREAVRRQTIARAFEGILSF